MFRAMVGLLAFLLIPAAAVGLCRCGRDRCLATARDAWRLAVLAGAVLSGAGLMSSCALSFCCPRWRCTRKGPCCRAPGSFRRAISGASWRSCWRPWGRWRLVAAVAQLALEGPQALMPRSPVPAPWRRRSCTDEPEHAVSARASAFWWRRCSWACRWAPAPRRWQRCRTPPRFKRRHVGGGDLFRRIDRWLRADLAARLRRRNWCVVCPACMLPNIASGWPSCHHFRYRGGQCRLFAAQL